VGPGRSIRQQGIAGAGQGRDKARGGGTHAQRAAGDVYRRPVPLPLLRRWHPRYGVTGSTPRARRRTARGAGALGAHGLRVRGHGTTRTGWQAHHARATCDVATRCRPAITVPMCLALDVFFSKILNRSAQSGKSESCRSHYPLQLLQRPSSVFLHGFCTKRC
jgi:hypothetical protein